MFQTTNQNLFHMFFVLLGLGTVSKPWFLDHMLQKWWSPWATDPPPARTGLYIIHHHTPNGPVEILDLPIKIVIFHNYVIYIYKLYIYYIWLVVLTLLKNDGVKVSCDDDIPNWLEKWQKCSKPPISTLQSKIWVFHWSSYWYCGWLRNPNHQLISGKHPIAYRVSTIQNWWFIGFRNGPSTVCQIESTTSNGRCSQQGHSKHLEATCPWSVGTWRHTSFVFHGEKNSRLMLLSWFRIFNDPYWCISYKWGHIQTQIKTAPSMGPVLGEHTGCEVV